MITAKEAREQMASIEDLKKEELDYVNSQILKAVKNSTDSIKVLVEPKVIFLIVEDLKNLGYSAVATNENYIRIEW